MRMYYVRSKTAGGKSKSKWHKVYANSQREAVLKHSDTDWRTGKPKTFFGLRMR